MTSLKSLTGACLVAIAAIGLGGCPAMSALSFVSADQVIERSDDEEVISQIVLQRLDTLGSHSGDYPDNASRFFKAAGCEQDKLRKTKEEDGETVSMLEPVALAVVAGSKYLASLVEKGLADKVSTLERKSVRSIEAQVETKKVGALADCVAFFRTLTKKGKKNEAIVGTNGIGLVVVLRKRMLGKLAYYELALAAADSTVALTKKPSNEKPAKIDLVVGLAITGSSTEPRLRTVTHATSITVKDLPLDGTARLFKTENADVERGDPFPAPDGSGLRYDMVVTEVGDLGFVPKDAQADLKNFFELLGPSYEAFVQNRVITPLEN
ncbi:hypothetical protein [Pyruvatibacter mobilis]|uniref:hypothetical protein n=1 Tax=Pyruvatibacter mobilis TaxID=1712261 RepID=UPI003BB0388F